jgi:hypothetical protein
MNKQSIFFFVLIALAQAGAWFQQFAQVRWVWFRNNQWFNILVVGTVVSFLFINGAKVGYTAWESVWKIRLNQFVVGLFVVAILSWITLGEGISFKTLVCLSLAFLIILIQIFWR